jgi:DNA invertase Pin-like site-specific DNA recombinase
MKYILYCRKSSESEDRQEQSIDSQERELLAIAKRQNLNVVKILKESKSAKKVGRPIFNELLAMLTAGKADGVLCWKLDRLSRNPIDTGYVQSLLQDGIIQNIKTFERDYFPRDNILMMVFEMGMANQYIRDLSVNVKRGNREKLARGEWPNHAPFGYLNDKATKTIVVDKEKAKYFYEKIFNAIFF